MSKKKSKSDKTEKAVAHDAEEELAAEPPVAAKAAPKSVG